MLLRLFKNKINEVCSFRLYPSLYTTLYVLTDQLPTVTHGSVTELSDSNSETIASYADS